MFDLHSLSTSDALRLTFTKPPGVETDAHTVCTAARHRRTPMGPPDSRLPRNPIVVDFAIEGTIKRCLYRPDVSVTPHPSTPRTLSITLVHRQGMMSRVHWSRIPDVIRHVLSPRIPVAVDTSTLYQELVSATSEDCGLELYLEASASQIHHMGPVGYLLYGAGQDPLQVVTENVSLLEGSPVQVIFNLVCSHSATPGFPSHLHAVMKRLELV